jgi:hypothetical protein
MKHLSDCSGPRADDRGLIIHYASFPKMIYLVKRISTSTCAIPPLFLAMLAPSAQWNAIFLLFHRGEIAKQRFKNEPISLGFTPRAR